MTSTPKNTFRPHIGQKVSVDIDKVIDFRNAIMTDRDTSGLAVISKTHFKNVTREKLVNDHGGKIYTVLHVWHHGNYVIMNEIKNAKEGIHVQFPTWMLKKA